MLYLRCKRHWQINELLKKYIYKMNTKIHLMNNRYYKTADARLTDDRSIEGFSFYEAVLQDHQKN